MDITVTTPLAGQPPTDTVQAGTELGDTDAVGCECALPFLTVIDVAHETARQQAVLDAALPWRALIASEQAARLQAESASRAKDEFLAMLGHELRNPLGAIASAVEVLNRVDAGTELAVNARLIIGRQTATWRT